MSKDGCEFGRGPDGYCTDGATFEQRVAQAELARRRRERGRQRLAKKTVEITQVEKRGEDDE